MKTNKSIKSYCMINGPRNIYKSQLASQRRIETVRKSPQAPVVNILV